MDDQKVVDTIRRIRHDFGNHLQVISGYLELGYNDRIKAYLKEIIEQMARERLIFESRPAELSLYLYEQVLLARDLGVILIYEDFDLQSLSLLKANQEPQRSLQELAGKIDTKDEPIIYLSVYEDHNGIKLLFDNDQFKENPMCFRLNRE